MVSNDEIKRYFSHDANARNSEKLLRLRMAHKAAGYGIYFMVLERLREAKTFMSIKDYNLLAFDFHEDAKLVKSVIEDFGLFVFTEDGKYFYSESFIARMGIKERLSKAYSEAGKKGANKRWAKKTDSQVIAEPSPTDSQVIAEPSPTDSQVIAEPSPTDSNKKKRKRKEKKDSSSVNRAREFCDILKDDDAWTEFVQLRFKISKEEVYSYIETFYLEINCKDTVSDNIGDFKNHLINWLRIQMDKKNIDNGKNRSCDTEKRKRAEAVASAMQKYI